MKYKDSTGKLSTSVKILKVNHAGEYGAINIYRSQLFICQFFMKDMTPLLFEFLNDEKRHMSIFWEEIQARNGIKCKSFYLCGMGGFFMGFCSSLLGRKGIMACTWAVESVVVNHLHEQLAYLKKQQDKSAYHTVEAILKDEENHRDIGGNYDLNPGYSNLLYTPLRLMIRIFTESIIRFGMR